MAYTNLQLSCRVETNAQKCEKVQRLENVLAVIRDLISMECSSYRTAVDSFVHDRQGMSEGSLQIEELATNATMESEVMSQKMVTNDANITDMTMMNEAMEGNPGGN